MDIGRSSQIAFEPVKSGNPAIDEMITAIYTHLRNGRIDPARATLSQACLLAMDGGVTEVIEAALVKAEAACVDAMLNAFSDEQAGNILEEAMQHLHKRTAP